MKKKLMTYGVLVVFVMFLTACNSKATAVVDYNNDFIIAEYVEDEKEYINLTLDYEQMISENSDDLATQETQLTEEIIPKSQALLDKVKSNEFEEEEVQDVHNILIESEELRHEAVEKELEAIQTGSDDTMDEAFEIQEKAREKKQAFLDKLNELVEEYDLEVDE